MALRRVAGHRPAPVRLTARALALQPGHGEGGGPDGTGRRQPGSRLGPGNALASGQDWSHGAALRGLKPMRNPNNNEKGGVSMVVATADKADIRGTQGPAIPWATRWRPPASRSRARDGSGRGSALFTRKRKEASRCTPTPKSIWCFGCGARGDVLDFVGRMEGLTLPEAIRRLDDGSTPPAAARSNQSTPTQRPTAASVPPRDPALLTAAARFYGGQLRRSPVALQYLSSRGIGLDAARRLGLGYATGHGLREHLQAVGFDGATAQRGIPACSWNGARSGSTEPSPFPTWPGARARWLTGRSVQPNARPRFQALPGPKPLLGLARLGLHAALGNCRRGRL